MPKIGPHLGRLFQHSFPAFLRIPSHDVPAAGPHPRPGRGSHWDPSLVAAPDRLGSFGVSEGGETCPKKTWVSILEMV